MKRLDLSSVPTDLALSGPRKHYSRTFGLSTIVRGLMRKSLHSGNRKVNRTYLLVAKN